MKPSIKHKFKAQRCERDGLKFPSKLEAAYFDQLKLRQLAGDIVFFLRQPCFDLGGGVKYLADFAVFQADGTVEFIDCKGMDLPIAIAKRKIAEDKYPIEIKIIKKV